MREVNKRGACALLCEVIKNNDTVQFQMVAQTLRVNGGLLTDVNPFSLQNFKYYEKEYGLSSLMEAFEIYNLVTGENRKG